MAADDGRLPAWPYLAAGGRLRCFLAGFARYRSVREPIRIKPQRGLRSKPAGNAPSGAGLRMGRLRPARLLAQSGSWLPRLGFICSLRSLPSGRA